MNQNRSVPYSDANRDISERAGDIPGQHGESEFQVGVMSTGLIRKQAQKSFV